MKVTWYHHRKRYKYAPHNMNCPKRLIANEPPEGNKTPIFKRRLSTIYCCPYYGFYTHLNSPEKLVHEVAVVCVSQRLRGLDNAAEIGIKQIHDDVQLVMILAHEQIFERYDVWVHPKISGTVRR